MLTSILKKVTRPWSIAVLATMIAVGPLAGVLAGPAGAIGAYPVIPGTWGTINTVPQVYNNDATNDFAVDASGNIYVIDTYNGITKYSPSTGGVTQLGTSDFYGASAFTVDGAGNVFIATGYGSIYEVSASGVESTYSNQLVESYYVSGIAVDNAGHVFVTAYNGTSSVWEFTNGVGSMIVGSIADSLSSIAVSPNGTIYATSYQYNSFGGNGLVYQINGSSVTTFGTGYSEPESVTVDSSGNVYVADEGGTVFMLTPGGVQSQLAQPPAGGEDEVFFAAGTLYLFAEDSSNALYTWSLAAPQPLSLNLFSSIATVSHNHSQSVTATWTGGAATSYLCTLLYGFGTLSTFTITTTSPTCTFSGLALGVSYGVQVVAYNGSAASSPSRGFSTPASFTITCKKGKLTHKVTGTNPRCPVGYHAV